MSRILIADDQPDVLEALRILLKGEGHQTDAVTSLGAVMNALEKRTYALLMMDLNYTRDTTSGQEGLEVIPRIQAIDETLPIVVMTAWATVDLAVEAMKLGARDFVTKPWDNDRLLAIVRTQIALGNALRKSQQLEAKNELLRGKMPNIISDSPRMRPVIELIARVAPSDANVLITGENGTGKGLVAQALHSLSTRASKIMITVNMGGLSEGVFESELFGHVKGAFTDAKTDRAGRFELADESTLFLDEIANLPMSQQAKLLRVIETGEFERVGSSRTLHANVRIISATNSNLHEEVAAGRFRQDLLFRLNTIEIALPPLRERREDIAPLAAHFPPAARRALSQKADRLRTSRARSAHASSISRQCARTGSCHRARRAHVAGNANQGKRSRPNDRVGRLPAPRGNEPRGSGSVPDQESARPARRQRAQGRRVVRPEPERLLPASPALWPLSETFGSAGCWPVLCEPAARSKSLHWRPPASTSQQRAHRQSASACSHEIQRRRRRALSHETRLTWLIVRRGRPGHPHRAGPSLVWRFQRQGRLDAHPCHRRLARLAFLASAREHIVRPLQTMSNLLAALREGDYSIRARGARAEDALGEVLLEINQLGETLRVQRLGAFEATALLRTIMAEIEVAVFTFDPDRRLRLVNRAGENLLRQPIDKLLGRRASDLGLAVCLDADEDAPLTLTFPGGSGRWGVRKSNFRERGLPHELLVLTDLSRTLREEERKAWQRLVRVLGHEMNNSLAPDQVDRRQPRDSAPTRSAAARLAR